MRDAKRSGAVEAGHDPAGELAKTSDSNCSPLITSEMMAMMLGVFSFLEMVQTTPNRPVLSALPTARSRRRPVAAGTFRPVLDGDAADGRNSTTVPIRGTHEPQ